MTTEQGTAGYAPPAWPAQPQPMTPRRSGWVTTAAVLLLVVGTISALGGVLLLVLALALGPAWTDILAAEPGMPTNVNPEALAGMMTGIFLVFAVIGLGWAAGHVAAGVGILGGRGWARVTGMVLAVIGLLFSLLLLALTLGSYGMTEAMMQDPEFRDLYGPGVTSDMMGASLVTSLLFVVPWLIGYLVVLVVLIRNGAFFNRPPQAVSPPIA